MRELLPLWGDEKAYVSVARKHIQNLEDVLREDRRRLAAFEDDRGNTDVSERPE
jgi:hypothetical protein